MPRRIASELLPTVGQIEILYSEDKELDAGWDRALADVGLEPRKQLRDQRRQRGRQAGSLPIVEAIHLFAEHNGELPSKPRLVEFAKLADIQIEYPRGPWGDLLDAAVAYRQTLGLTDPTEHPKPRGGAERTKPPVKAPPPGSIPGVSRRRRNSEPKYSIEECVSAIRRFLDETDGRKTQANYVGFASKNGLPSISCFPQLGGWTHLKRDAERQP